MSEWRSWRDTPPQIADKPIEIAWEGDFGNRYHYIVTAFGLAKSGLPVAPRFLQWKATGQYRQEYFEVTGQWL